MGCSSFSVLKGHAEVSEACTGRKPVVENKGYFFHGNIILCYEISRLKLALIVSVTAIDYDLI